MSFIQAYRNKYTVKKMCRVLKFPRSTYYAVINHKASGREQEYNRFTTQVLSVYTEFKKRYDAIKLQKELSDRGIQCSVKRVQRHMHRLGIKSIVIKKYQYSKNCGRVPDDKKNILNRDFKANTVFKKLVTDITYIHVANEGWTYSASVMDLYDHKIIGWYYGKNITAEPITQAVRNACIESFHSALKKEEVYTTTYNTFEEAKTALFEYIESLSNHKRRHSSLGYKTPQQVEDEALTA